MTVGEMILRYGGYAGGLAAIIGLLFKFKDIKAWINARREVNIKEADNQHKELLKAIAGINDHLTEIDRKIDTMQKDIVVSQMNDLKQLYGKYISWGWCTLEEKQGFLDLYDRYHSQGHNSMGDSMRNDVAILPTNPPKTSLYYTANKQSTEQAQ